MKFNLKQRKHFIAFAILTAVGVIASVALTSRNQRCAASPCESQYKQDGSWEAAVGLSLANIVITGIAYLLNKRQRSNQERGYLAGKCFNTAFVALNLAIAITGCGFLLDQSNRETCPRDTIGNCDQRKGRNYPVYAETGLYFVLSLLAYFTPCARRTTSEAYEPINLETAQSRQPPRSFNM